MTADYYVMKSNSAYAGGYEKISSHSCRSAAEKKAKSGYDWFVWDQRQYDEWHSESIMPYYR